MYEKRIEEYARYFNGKLDSILELKDSKEDLSLEYPDSSIIMFKKTLLVSFLDALSKIAYGKKWGRNRKRFITFLENFGDWPNGARLSTPHLNKALELDEAADLEPFRLHVRRRLKDWRLSDTGITLENDMEQVEVDDLLAEKIDKLFEIALERFNHYNLLWKSRNGLIHEFRELGYGIEVPGDQQPYYHLAPQLGALSEDVDSWQLVYPLEFLASLARTALTNLVEDLKRNDLNPDKRFRFGTYYFDEMNPEWK